VIAPGSLRAEMLRRVARFGEWTTAGDIFLAFGVAEPSDDRKRYDRLSVTLSRLHRGGLLEVDKSRVPWAYRVSPAGRRELALVSDPTVYRRHIADRMRALCAQRWQKAAA
jgi:hypothetical protein